MRRLPRWLHRVYAAIAGYFWTACPTCGCMFGGHERHGSATREGHLTCSRCHVEPLVRLSWVNDVPVAVVEAGSASDAAAWLDAWGRPSALSASRTDQKY